VSGVVVAGTFLVRFGKPPLKHQAPGPDRRRTSDRPAGMPQPWRRQDGQRSDVRHAGDPAKAAASGKLFALIAAHLLTSFQGVQTEIPE